MGELRWTKLQDFCLRLGLLKALVAVLPRQRQPLPREELVRRLQKTLFGINKPTTVRGSQTRADAGRIPRADRLLRESQSASWGQPIHASTAYKIVEWGLTTGLVVSGNRISERGLLLRTLIGEPNVEAFVKEREAWNPFDVTPAERAFLLYHLGESDELMLQIAIDVGTLGAGAVCDAARSHKITAQGLKHVLRRAEHGLELQDRARFATVRELSAMIDWEVGEGRDTPRPRSRHAKATPPRRRASGSAAGKRVTRKSADHQAIPRFEQLVDLGVVTKLPEGDDASAFEKARKAWTFVVTAEAQLFAAAAGGPSALDDRSWLWTRFAKSVGASGIAGAIVTREATDDEALALFLESFDLIRRPVGHTPFEATAILTMVRGLRKGVTIEIATMHDLMLKAKREGGLGGRVSFAAGNDMKRMYLMVGRGRRESPRT